MKQQISSSLKTTFLIHAIVALVFGVIYLIFPVQFGNIIDWVVQEPFMYRLLGAALFGLGVSSWLAYQASTWEQVRIVVLMEIAWTVLGSLICLWGLLAGGLPTVVWLNFIILVIFAVAFIAFYRQAEMVVNQPKPVH